MYTNLKIYIQYSIFNNLYGQKKVKINLKQNKYFTYVKDVNKIIYDLIFSNYDELSAEIDIRIELFRKKLEERESLIENAIDQLTKFEDDIKDNKSMIVENTQEIHQAFEAIMENTEFSRHTKETLTKRIMELYGPY